MIKIIDKRGTKKTYKLMLEARTTRGVIVCANPRAMQEKAYGYGLIGIDFISYEQFINNYEPNDIGDYYIDELEDFVRYVASSSSLKGNLMGYTITEEE